MAGFKMSKAYTMARKDIREAAQGLAQQLEREHGVRCRWKGDCVQLKGAGVQGELSFADDVIDVSVTLGLLMRPFQSVLKAEVQRYLDEHVY